MRCIALPYLICGCLLGACAPAPVVPGAPVRALATDAPDLVPLEPILAAADGGAQPPTPELSARARALQARAARLRRARVVSPGLSRRIAGARPSG